MAKDKKEETVADESAETVGIVEKTAAAETAAEQPVEDNREQSQPVDETKAVESGRQKSKAVDEKSDALEKSAEPDWKTLYALTLADFDNYKKRAVRDREDVYRYAEADILKDILPAVDNLALALSSAGERGSVPAEAKGSADGEETVPATVHASFVKGVQLVYDSLLKSLKDHGAEPFDSVGKPLDTEKMEAIATLPDDKVEEGRVSIESKKGWMLKDKVLRAAQVVVSSGKPA